MEKVRFAQKINSTVIITIEPRKLLGLKKENPSRLEIEVAYRVKSIRLIQKLADNASKNCVVKNILEELHAVQKAAEIMGFVDLYELYAAASQPPPPRGILGRGYLTQRK